MNQTNYFNAGIRVTPPNDSSSSYSPEKRPRFHSYDSNKENYWAYPPIPPPPHHFEINRGFVFERISGAYQQQPVENAFNQQPPMNNPYETSENVFETDNETQGEETPRHLTTDDESPENSGGGGGSNGGCNPPQSRIVFVRSLIKAINDETVTKIQQNISIYIYVILNHSYKTIYRAINSYFLLVQN